MLILSLIVWIILVVYLTYEYAPQFPLGQNPVFRYTIAAMAITFFMAVAYWVMNVFTHFMLTPLRELF